MSPDIAISVKNVGKTFCIPHEKVSSIRGAFVGMFFSFHQFFNEGLAPRGRRGRLYEEFDA
jgi:hypothetical protein